jgi:hypothetical protein
MLKALGVAISLCAIVAGSASQASIISAKSGDGQILSAIRSGNDNIVGIEGQPFVQGPGEGAGGHVISILQSGSGNTFGRGPGESFQLGTVNQATIVQSGAGSHVDLQQTGSFNGNVDGIAGAVTQPADDSTITIVQNGIANTFLVTQDGSRHVQALNQTGAGNAATLGQTGSGHRMAIEQSGTGNAVTADQAGSGHLLTVQQSGIGNTATMIQTGSAHYAQLIQSGVGNTITGTQAGTGNQAFITQSGNGSTAVFSQSGSLNVIRVSQ